MHSGYYSSQRVKSLGQGIVYCLSTCLCLLCEIRNVVLLEHQIQSRSGRCKQTTHEQSQLLLLLFIQPMTRKQLYAVNMEKWKLKASQKLYKEVLSRGANENQGGWLEERKEK